MRKENNLRVEFRNNPSWTDVNLSFSEPIHKDTAKSFGLFTMDSMSIQFSPDLRSAKVTSRQELSTIAMRKGNVMFLCEQCLNAYPVHTD